MAVILDSDYAEHTAGSTDGLVLFEYLPCKEIENLLLLQPEAIANRVAKLLEQREGGVPYPSAGEVAKNH